MGYGELYIMTPNQLVLLSTFLREPCALNYSRFLWPYQGLSSFCLAWIRLRFEFAFCKCSSYVYQCAKPTSVTMGKETWELTALLPHILRAAKMCSTDRRTQQTLKLTEKHISKDGFYSQENLRALLDTVLT